jgi:hypothetical protein
MTHFPTFEGEVDRARTLRLADGPDEVQKVSIAKSPPEHYHAGDSRNFGN